MESKYFECICSSTEHIFKVQKMDEDTFISVHLATQPLFRRIWLAIKYVFGYTCKYGHFDEVVLDKDKVLELCDFLLEDK